MNKLNSIFKRKIGFYYRSPEWREAIVEEIEDTYGDGNFITSYKEDSYAVTIEIAGDTVVRILDLDHEGCRGYRFDEVYVEASLKSDTKAINILVAPSLGNREKTIHFIGTETTIDFYFN